MMNAASDADLDRRSAREVFLVFLRLGLTSFGGPIAHLGHFRRELVTRRGWIDEQGYAQLIGLCQFLPGPASSQLGFAIGLLRAGWLGALAAFVAFTLPSVALMLTFAAFAPRLDGPWALATLHGLKLVAVMVVADGILGMTRTLCPDGPRRSIALLAMAALLLAETSWMQLAVVACGALAGLVWCRHVSLPDGVEPRLPYGVVVGRTLLLTFALLLVVLPLVTTATEGNLSVLDSFYRAGALVFGGGHVVLPLLQDAVVVPGWLSHDDFLAGYGAAQALPGPMFSFAAYLGARLIDPPGGTWAPWVALAGIFLPGFLLVSGILPMWGRLGRWPGAARAITGVNAAVVGLLAAALYDPLWTGAVRGLADVVIVLTGVVLLRRFSVSALVVVVGCVTATVSMVASGP